MMIASNRPLLQSVRTIDRAVLDVSRKHNRRPMETYLLLSLDENNVPQSTAFYAERIAASSSQTKQVALVLQADGLVTRIGRTGYTEITPEGRAKAKQIRSDLSIEINRVLSNVV